MQSGYDINVLVREAQTRWLKPVEVFFILQNYEEHQLTHTNPVKPTGGSLYLFNKRELKYFRKDGHRWRRRKDQRTVAEAHERLKVGNVEALNCYYAHGEDNPNFQRRSYWILDTAYEHIVLVHYRDTTEGRQRAGSTSQLAALSSPNVTALSSPTFTPSSNNSFATNQTESPFVISESYELYHNQSSPSSAEISSNEVMKNLGLEGRINEASSSSDPHLNQVLQKLRQQLSLKDDEVQDSDTLYIENGGTRDLEDALREYELSGQISNGSNNLFSQQDSNDDADIWKDILGSSNNFPNVKSLSQNSSSRFHREVNSMEYPTNSIEFKEYGIDQNSYPSLFDQAQFGNSLEDNIGLTIAQKQKFSIQEICPEWCYTSEGAKIFIVGSFLCDPSESEWACMFGDTEVPVQIIKDGLIRCQAPPHLQGNVTLCVTSKNRESCSEVRDFEYRAKPNVYATNNPVETETAKGLEEQLLLVQFVQMIMSDLGESRNVGDPWSHIMDAVLVGTSTYLDTLDWLLQELLKEKLEVWLSSRLQKNNEDCSLSKKEQGIIHMAAAMGFEWALQPILDAGVNVNFRDINGWTALHWAARFGREKMVAALIASGASAGAVTDPNVEDLNGKTPASIAANCGHKGLAGYLSEVELTSHLTSLVLVESEISKGSAVVEAERTVNSLSNANPSSNEDQVSLKHTLAAVRNAAQAAARIQSAFRAHSFRKRQLREADDSADEYSLLGNDIRELSAASKLAFGNAREFNTAALSIQKKYRGWKNRRDYLTLRRKVVKIQAHVRGYQVRKNYKVCWAVGILEKVVLRWRRRGVGLRGYRPDSESIDQSEDEDILKVFRKQKVDAAIDEAVSRVLSMVESPVARQQYHRILERYRQAKAVADRLNAESDIASSLSHDSSYSEISYMEK